MERTIRVTGRGKVSVRPDTIELGIFLNKVYPEYRQAMDASAEYAGTMKAAAERAGFVPEELKTTGFSVNMNYEGEYDENGKWQNKFTGYRYEHSLVIRFPLDNEKLGRLLGELIKCGSDAEISIHHTVKDPEPARQELLKKAVNDSRLKAEALAESAGVTLGKIVNVDYSWDEVEIFNRTAEGMTFGSAKMNAMEDSLDIDIEADDIRLQDTVTVIWEII